MQHYASNMKYILPSLLVFLLGTALPAVAQTPFENPLRTRSLNELLHAFLGIIIYLGTIALLLGFVWTGALFVFAQGKAEKLSEARRALVWTLIGGAILLGAEGIAAIIEATGSRL